MVDKLTEVKHVEDIEIGAVYATFWIDHDLDVRRNRLIYTRVIDVRKSRSSFDSLVRSDAGNRSFSKLRWFGPLPSTRADLLGEEQ